MNTHQGCRYQLLMNGVRRLVYLDRPLISGRNLTNRYCVCSRCIDTGSAERNYITNRARQNFATSLVHAEPCLISRIDDTRLTDPSFSLRNQCIQIPIFATPVISSKRIWLSNT